MLIVYEYDLNYILSKDIPNQQASYINNNQTKIYNKTKLKGYAHKLHILDNKCSEDLNNDFQKTQ